MTEIRIHGRGGQGAVVAAQILAGALFREGRWVQGFPAFGMERRGAPVAAFVRYDERPIRRRSYIYTPDHVVVLDAGLLGTGLVLKGLKPGGWVLVNSSARGDRLGIPKEFRVGVVDASGIAVRNQLGSLAMAIVNTALVGAFAGVPGGVGFAGGAAAFAEGVPAKRQENANAARQAYDLAEKL